jgi:Zn-dependent M16 (insulinase) family peptidase
VLAGSERYPVKDAFNELLKGTLQTFINAFTFPDKTIYPVASQLKKDFFNLARVYTDLVLKPRLLKETFYQEGHHFEFTNPEDIQSDLTISGIVYNEMKGAYSSPDNLMFKVIQENIFSDNTYVFDSGGNPDVIPALTYEQFKAFHEAYYSPSNAMIFLYGNIPTTEHLAFLEEMLSGFERIRIDSAIPNQPKWSKPTSVKSAYPIAKDQDLHKKAAVNMAWMMAENTDYETILLLEVVSGALVGSAAGPLRKALIDSGLGEDISPITGLERDLKQVVFGVGLRGTDIEKAPQIEELILNTLRTIVSSGFEQDLIEGVLHQVEFHGKEILRKAYPYGIVLMGRVFHTWLYDGDPLSGLNFPKMIDEVRHKWKLNHRLFQDIIQTWFINNPHRILSIMEPSQTYNDELTEAFKKKMAGIKAHFSHEALENIRREAASLKKYQTEPDSPEALKTLPKLKISDISKTIETIPTEKTEINEVPIFKHDLFTNGIAYMDLAFDVSDIPEELQPYLPLMGKLITNMGAAGLSYEDMAKRIALNTGGLGYHLAGGLMVDPSKNWQKMIFRIKALHRNTAEAVKIITDILTDADLSNEGRMQDLIAEKKNDLHASVIPSGHLFAKMAAGAGLSIPAYRDEQWHGRMQLRLIAQIAEQFDLNKKHLQEKLQMLCKMVFCRKRLHVNLTADAKGLRILSDCLVKLMERLTCGGKIGNPSLPQLQPVYTGISIPAQVSYVAKVLTAPTFADDSYASLLVASRYLSSSYLYKRIRVQGGAYGGMSVYDPMSGLFAFLSYRDPHISNTLEIYHDAMDFIAQHKISMEELEKMIIGTIGTLDKPMDASSQGYTAMIREFAEFTNENRQANRNNILNTTADSLQEAACRYFEAAASSAMVAVYAADEHLHKANENMEKKLTIEALLQ